MTREESLVELADVLHSRYGITLNDVNLDSFDHETESVEGFSDYLEKKFDLLRAARKD